MSVVHKNPFVTKTYFKKTIIALHYRQINTHNTLFGKPFVVRVLIEAYEKIYLLHSETSKYTQAPHAYKRTPMHRLRCYGLPFMAALR